jgi:hypothetical protein
VTPLFASGANEGEDAGGAWGDTDGHVGICRDHRQPSSGRREGAHLPATCLQPAWVRHSRPWSVQPGEGTSVSFVAPSTIHHPPSTTYKVHSPGRHACSRAPYPPLLYTSTVYQHCICNSPPKHQTRTQTQTRGAHRLPAASAICPVSASSLAFRPTNQPTNRPTTGYGRSPRTSDRLISSPVLVHLIDDHPRYEYSS